MTIDPQGIMLMVEIDAIHTAGEVDASGACRDAKDDKFLAYAVEGRADFIVTGDADLLELRNYQGIPIVRAHELVAMIKVTDEEER